ncbi:MAG: hypothetical protein RR144_04430 [Clostridia bacterium]
MLKKSIALEEEVKNHFNTNEQWWIKHSNELLDTAMFWNYMAFYIEEKL